MKKTEPILTWIESPTPFIGRVPFQKVCLDMLFRFSRRKKKATLLGNSGYPDQSPHSALSDLGLYCLPIALLGISRLKWVKSNDRQKRIHVVIGRWKIYVGNLFYSRFFFLFSGLILSTQADNATQSTNECSFHQYQTCVVDANCTEDQFGVIHCICPEGVPGDGRKDGTGCGSKFFSQSQTQNRGCRVINYEEVHIMNVFNRPKDKKNNSQILTKVSSLFQNRNVTDLRTPAIQMLIVTLNTKFVTVWLVMKGTASMNVMVRVNNREISMIRTPMAHLLWLCRTSFESHRSITQMVIDILETVSYFIIKIYFVYTR